MKMLNQSGSHILTLTLSIVSAGIVGLAGFRVLHYRKTTNTESSSDRSSTSNEKIEWAFNEKTLKWFPKSGTPPACPNPILTISPVDLNQISNIGMPGAYRGFSYKPHGGFRVIDTTNGDLTVVLPNNATLTGITRYYEGSPAELQYLLNFETDCGIAFRFDHLSKLSSELQKIANTTPEPKINDTRSYPNQKFIRTVFKTGYVLATKVGFQKNRNFGFDFGVYDYRQPNKISQDPTWASIHNQYQSLEWYGVCWLNLFPQSSSSRAIELANEVLNPSKPERNQISDYCTNAKYKTLDFNNGHPTDG